MPHAIYIIFLFALGACVGSFLNVVVWRVPRTGFGSLISPPSHCPQCQHRLAWYDNIPIFGWLLLRGKCRYCGLPISARYPIFELITALIFVGYYVAFFMFHIGPCAPRPQIVGTNIFHDLVYGDRFLTTMDKGWGVYGLYMVLLAALLAVSRIDAEMFIIPPEIPWFLAILGLFAHALIDRPELPGALSVARTGLAGPMAAGGGVGLLVSMVLFWRGILPESFPEGEPVGDIDEELYEAEVKLARQHNRPIPPRPRTYTKAEIRVELGKEILFLLPPMLGALVAGTTAMWLRPVAGFWFHLLQYDWLAGLLGAALGALIGGMIIWVARILGTLSLGKVAMGLGDVHLMFGVGAITGAGVATLAFFIAPFLGLAVGLWGLILRRRHELPYGPYLSMGTAVAVLIYCPVANHFGPGFRQIALALRSILGG